VTLKVEGTLDELRRLFLGAAEKELKDTAKKAGKAAVKKVVKATTRKLSAWQRYMKQKKNQIKFTRGPQKGLLNMKAMAKAFRRKNGTKKGEVRKTARRAYER